LIKYAVGIVLFAGYGKEKPTYFSYKSFVAFYFYIFPYVKLNAKCFIGVNTAQCRS